jgi:hypothetical protein
MYLEEPHIKLCTFLTRFDVISQQLHLNFKCVHSGNLPVLDKHRLVTVFNLQKYVDPNFRFGIAVHVLLRIKIMAYESHCSPYDGIQLAEHVVENPINYSTCVQNNFP